MAWTSSPIRWRLLAVAAAAIACLRIASTWGVFNETYDEPIHLACGMEWLDQGRYRYEAQHPPLSRIAAALGPWLAGGRSHGLKNPIEEGQAILYGSGDAGYFRVLALARAGNLVFVLLACFGVWALARTYWGTAESAWSVAAFSLLPPVLGHGGLATTDMSLTAALVLAAAAWRRLWLAPSAGRAALAGAAAGLAIAAKFTAFLFLPAVLAPLLGLSAAVRPKRALRLGAIAAGCCFLLVWAVYRFEAAPLHRPGESPFVTVDRMAGQSGPLHDAAYRMLEAPLPLTTLARGLGEVYFHNYFGHEAYLLGEVRRTGWWYFFPVLLAVKTPLPFLLLLVAGAWWLAAGRKWPELATLLAAVALVAVCLPSRINIGVRHVLPFYALAALPAGYAIARLGRRPWLAGIVVAGWAVAGAAAHPDYLAEFNLLAGSEPARVAVDSDLDWGQDLERTTSTLAAMGVREASIAYHGVYDLRRERRVRYSQLPPGRPVRGWVAISARMQYVERARKAQGEAPHSYDWLTAYPVRRVGRSMFLYRAGD